MAKDKRTVEELEQSLAHMQALYRVVRDALDDTLTVRDHFALAILSGAAAGLNTIHDAEQFAKNVYLMADFMLKAREAE